MTTLAIIPTNPCLVQSSRKRKRTTGLHVRFCTQPQNIIYTYSQSDYDRSGLVPDIDSQQQKQQYILALSINLFQNEEQVHPTATMKSKINNKRPKLSIDTSNLSGPLYFTNMTTNHQKKPFVEEVEIVDDEGIDVLTKENTRRNSLPLIIC